jgi:hypothetical protein
VPLNGRTATGEVGIVKPSQQTGLGAGQAATPWGHVRISSPDIAVSFTALLNGDGARPTDGGPRHELSGRVKDTGVPEYRGHDPIRMQLSIILDGYQRRVSVESLITLIKRLSTRLPDEPRMPVVRLHGPVQYEGRRWVVDGALQWDTTPQPRRMALGGEFVLVRQPITIPLLEKTGSAVLTDSVSRGRRQGKGQKKTPVVYITRQGQNDLGDVAKAVYGSRRRAVEIALFNRISIATRVRPNMRIRIP